MKILAICMQCLTELGHPSFEPIDADYYDDGIAYITCSAGHKTAHLIQSSKFEVLLEAGAIALLEGFTFEACASFSASLERFYEFALEVMCDKHKIPLDLYTSMFKEMARQSERQLGAFLLLHAIDFGEPFKPDVKITEFRNSVIHKGLIPNPKEAKDFAARIYVTIQLLNSRLSENHFENMLRITNRRLHEKQVNIPNEIKVSTSSGTMFFNALAGQPEESFAKALDDFRKAREAIAGALPEMQRLHDSLKNYRGA